MRIFRETYAVTFSLVLVVSLCGCVGEILEVEEYDEGGLDGYTLLSAAILQPFLIDMQGNKIHQYSASDGIFGKVMPGGTIITSEPMYSTPPLEFEWGRLVQEAWNHTIEWSFREWEEVPNFGWSARMHHDWQREGNPVGYYAPGQDSVEQGNTLVLAHANEVRPGISSIALLDDILYEIDWEGNPVFEWHAADHVEEFGFDEAARAEIDARGGDWLHINSISWLGENHWYDSGDTRFHPRNLILDSFRAGFILIIDQQTGGVVWRVGPDYSEGNPEAALGPIIGPHHAHMIPKGLPGEGNILLVDNGGHSGYGGPGQDISKYTRDYSRVVEFDPTTVEIVWEYSPGNGDYLPFSEFCNSAQRLPNGNTLIASGINGIVLEVTPDRRVVWKCSYLVGSIPSRIYRAYRVPSQWLPENPRGYFPWIPQGCIDNDNDGYGNPASALCTYPDWDCDDSNADVNPGAQEVCTNGLDDDCDADVDCDDADCVSDPSCDPCTPNPCTTPPAPACDVDGITLHDYVSPGNCTDVGGTPGCDYPPLDIDCSVAGQICVTNACVAP